ncbi:ABC transporter permease [Occallatibacter riparius]|uniref:ABC transporter permease n=1 Tax=Occallatibacter riparius TaxID=1002689 RepID=A0A9J7BYR2_9BACT|nr:ABC transporter permease [Occallatibacter riparius]UWZ86693.1 ABC transporter permease [Occallatibacter riparius]
MLDDLRYRTRALIHHKQIEDELDEELRFHFDRQVEKLMRSGMSEQEAKRQARLSFGGHEQVKEDCRDARGTGLIELTIDDTKYALRQLVANPTFAIVMIATLALSIGANSAIFSVINGVLLKRLPYDQPERLVRVFLTSQEFPKFPLNPWDFLDFRARNHSFESMAAFTRGDVQLSGDGEPVRLNGFGITSGYFRVLGLHPQLGREFDFQAEVPGNGLQVVLSDRLWRTRFGADPNIIGRKITLNMQPFTVIGVMPPGTEHPGNVYHSVAYGESVDVWWPFSFGGNSNQRGSHYIEGIARLKAGVSVQQAHDEMNAIMAQIGREHSADGTGWRVLLIPLYSEVVGNTRRMLLVLLGAVGIVLLIACANAANLLLARASARQREIAVRLALGAPRLRVIRQLITESLIISLTGGVLGLALAFGGVRGLVSLLPADFPRAHDIHVSWPVLGFTLLISVLTGILFGLAPALQASHTDPKTGLQQGSRSSTATRPQNRLRNALVVAEVSLACVLLIGAGLMLRTFLNLLHLNPGFSEDRVLTASLSLPHQRYKTGEQTAQFYSRLSSTLSQLPGVVSAGAGSDLPWTGYDENNGGWTIEGKKPDPHNETHARYHMATPGYFSAMGIPLLEGRFFTEADKKGAPWVLIINWAMAQKYWPGEDVIGRRISFEDNPKKDEDWMTVVGVVGDVKDQPNSPAAEPAFWWSEYQASESDMSIAIRTQSDPRQVADGLRNAVHQLDPELAVADIKLMNQVADASISTPRFTFVLVGLFAALAVVLAGIGAYGVIAYTVAQRSTEFGLRVALGAQRGDLLRMVLVHSAKLAVPGTIIGVALALSLGRVMQTLIYGVSTADPLIYGCVILMVPAVALLASYVPARRAARADPMQTLRAE